MATAWSVHYTAFMRHRVVFCSVRPFQRAVATFLFSCLLGCTTMQATDKPLTELQDTLAAGDKIRVIDTQGSETDLIFVAIEDGVLQGSSQDTPDQIVHIQLDEIETIETKKFSIMGTILAGAGGYVVLVLIAIAQWAL